MVRGLHECFLQEDHVVNGYGALRAAATESLLVQRVGGCPQRRELLRRQHVWEHQVAVLMVGRHLCIAQDWLGGGRFCHSGNSLPILCPQMLQLAGHSN